MAYENDKHSGESCPICGGILYIRSSLKITDKVRVVYLQCKNIPNCGASFNYHLSFNKMISPPIPPEHHIVIENNQVTIFE